MTESITKSSGVVPTRATIRDLAIAKLRSAIHSGQLAPNETLSERDLCARMGISRSSLRESLQRLEAEGLVTRSRNNVLSVASISEDEARQIYQIRALLEPEIAAQFVAKASVDDIRRLKVVRAEIEKASKAGDPEKYFEATSAYSSLLCTGSGNKIAHEVLRTLESRIGYLRTLTMRNSSSTRRNETIGIGRRIVGVVEARDAEGMRALVSESIARSARFAQLTIRKLQEEQKSN